MTVLFHKNFEKQYKKLSRNSQHKFKDRIQILRSDVFNPILNNHPLRGKYAGYRSIEVSGDLRAIYKTVGNDVFLFVTIGSHNYLYS